MENEILNKVLAGDIHAYRYFVNKYQGMSFAIANGILNDPIESEEVVQDGFLKAFKGLNKFKRQAKFSTWLHQIIYREAIRRAKKKKRAPFTVDITEIADHFFVETSETVGQLEQTERTELIQKILNQLKPKERLVLQLFYLHEKSMQEIVEITDLSLSNIKVILHRARKHFYTQLENTGQKAILLEK